jgi:hypothetical protein
MKTIAIILVVLTAVALACKGIETPEGDLIYLPRYVQFHEHEYVMNPFMPYDCVELVGEYNPDEFFLTKPTWRADNVTPTMVLARVYKSIGAGNFKFCGWLWLEVDLVTKLHSLPELQPARI